MKLLQEAKNEMAYLKAGIFGFQGSGKTYTATKIAIGFCAQYGLRKPIAFMDTETGSDFMIPMIIKGGMPKPVVAKVRAFMDMLEIIKEAEQECSFLIIDSITHVWRDLCESYQQKLNRKRLQFQDWSIIKGEWGRYTDLFVNSQLHIIACGRAGYEYDYDVNEDGSKDLIKTGTKMKVEGEFGFEPSLVIEMERVSQQKEEIEKLPKAQKQAHKTKVGSAWIHRAHILKDRTDTINGRSFDQPTYKDFKPHFDALSIGGHQMGIDTARTSEDLFDEAGDTEWRKKQKQREITLEEIQAEMVRMVPGQSAAEKRFKIDLIENLFLTTSWAKVETLNLDTLMQGLKRLRDMSVTYAGEQKFSEFYNNFNAVKIPDDVPLEFDEDEAPQAGVSDLPSSPAEAVAAASPLTLVTPVPDVQAPPQLSSSKRKLKTKVAFKGQAVNTAGVTAEQMEKIFDAGSDAQSKTVGLFLDSRGLDFVRELTSAEADLLIKQL